MEGKITMSKPTIPVVRTMCNHCQGRVWMETDEDGHFPDYPFCPVCGEDASYSEERMMIAEITEGV